MFKKRKWSKWQDVNIYTKHVSAFLVQTRTCELTGDRQFKETIICNSQDIENINKIKTKLGI